MLTCSRVSTNSAGPAHTECGAGYVSGVSGSVSESLKEMQESAFRSGDREPHKEPRGAIALPSARKPIDSVMSILPQLRDTAKAGPLLK